VNDSESSRAQFDAVASYFGCLMGTAIGDALGLPREGLSRRRGELMFGQPPLMHRFILGRGMVSDDTDHAVMTAQALLASAGDLEQFRRDLGWRLRWWLLSLPAGVGLATLRACLKLCLGFSPTNSGVWSAGNGAAMRAAILGVYECHDDEKLWQLVQASSRITHTDPRAEQGSMAVALAAKYSMTCDDSRFLSDEYLALAAPYIQEGDLAGRLRLAVERAEEGVSALSFADELGLQRGVSGFVNHTVPVAIFCWLRHRFDFRAALEAAICLGGDTDTVGAIVGGLVGIRWPAVAWPEEWELGSSHLRSLADQLADSRTSRRPVTVHYPCWPLVLVRNTFFAAIVLVHGFRRLLPPY
jgi:ADP-ribosyl-[dinitrogen reductase] hydrolase